MTPSNPTNSQPLIYRIADALGVFHIVAPVNHTHTQSEVDGLETALAGKMPLKTIDSAPANNADHLVSSKGVYTALLGKSNTDHTHDHIILAGVGRMGVSEDTETKDGYVWVVLWDDTQETEVTYLIKKEDLLKWLNPDSTPTANSTKFVTSGGVKASIDDATKAVFGSIPYYITAAHEKMHVHTIILRNNTGTTIRLGECIDVSTLPAEERANIYWNTPNIDIPNDTEIGIRFVRTSNSIFLWYDGNFDY